MAVLQTDLFAKYQKAKGCRGHEAQAADLDERNDDDLTETAPLSPCVIQYQTRDTGGGGSREQCRAKTAADTVSRCGGQHQKQAAQQNDAGEGYRNDLGGTQWFPALFEPPGQ